MNENVLKAIGITMGTAFLLIILSLLFRGHSTYKVSLVRAATVAPFEKRLRGTRIRVSRVRGRVETLSLRIYLLRKRINRIHRQVERNGVMIQTLLRLLERRRKPSSRPSSQPTSQPASRPSR